MINSIEHEFFIQRYRCITFSKWPQCWYHTVFSLVRPRDLVTKRAISRARSRVSCGGTAPVQGLRSRRGGRRSSFFHKGLCILVIVFDSSSEEKDFHQSTSWLYIHAFDILITSIWKISKFSFDIIDNQKI